MADGSPEELWQAYNERCEPLVGVGLTKAQARAGALHASAHVWCWRHHNDAVEILLQHRSESIRTWPGYYDVSTAGHIDAGERPVEAALREAHEELGLSLEEGKLHHLFVNRVNFYIKEADVTENEFQYVYGIELPEDVAFEQDAKEVADVMWVPFAELGRFADGVSTIKAIPHGRAYFTMLEQQLIRAQRELEDK